jgi:signal transduction histidine kinase
VGRRSVGSVATVAVMNGTVRARIERALIDWLAPATIGVIGVVDVSRLARSADYPGPPLEHLPFLAIAVVALGLRRKAPLAAPLSAIGAVIWWSAAMWPAGSQGPFEGFVVLVGAAYSIGALNRGWRLAVGAAVLAATFAVGEVVLLADGGRNGDLLPVGFWLSVALAVGVFINRRSEQARDARQRAVALIADRERHTVRAIEDERARIARELHDVVAHSLSVIVVQAAAERRSLSQGADTASLETVLSSIERAGREALVDLRRLLGLLRRVDGPAALAPQPGLAQLDDLVSQVREAGVAVDVRVTGDRTPLPSGLDLTAYRIVQEALTNVLKHAHASRVVVAVTFHRNQLEVEVSDDGAGHGDDALTHSGAGHGLIGMRERISIFDGTLSSGPRPGGGWTVRARLPLAPSAIERV